MSDVQHTPPASEPITAAELRAHLRDVPDGDAALEALISAAREFAEEETGLIMIQQTRRLTLDNWPFASHGDGRGSDGLGWWDGVRDGAIIGAAPRFLELPRAPLISITSITTFDTEGDGVVWQSGNYLADTGNRPGRVVLEVGGTWPIPTRPAAGIVILYVAGHADAAAVPRSLRLAILQIAAHWYENRELVDYDGPQKVSMQAGRILKQARIMRL